MQCLAARSIKVAPAAGVRRAVPVARGVVRCQASLQKKVAAAITMAPYMLAASPAFALVDDRLNGDGAGLPLGINDARLAWVLSGMQLLLWVFFFNAQKDFGDFEDKDSGVGL